ncbi:MAG: hypothetical protein PF495_00710 [Spirochaetales bacterium]|jgi:hypothetical protein|nr:hypothetical protein [Spirochaetales bacterium]
MVDPVEVDLARHLDEEDRAQAMSDAEEAKVIDWLKDPAKCIEAISEILENEDLSEYIAKAMAKQDKDKLFDIFDESLRDKFSEWAPQAVRDDIEQSNIDAAEARAESREMESRDD